MNARIQKGLNTVGRCSYWLLERCPMFGGLTGASPRAFAEAFKEIMFVWSLSLLPIILSSFIDSARSGAPSSQVIDLLQAAKQNLKTGEIFIYANALLAPIGFVLYKHNRDNARYPNHIAFVWVLLCLVPLSAVIFALQRAGIITNVGLINRTALGIFIFAFFMRYTSLVYDSLRVDFVTTQKAQENKLVEQVRKFSQGK